MQREFGRYRLLRHLATGGMGEVYSAEAVGAAGFAKRVVIKTLRADLAADGDLVRQFVAEGRLLEALDHPNIAQILDLGLASDTYFLAIEMVEGFDLRALQRALPLGEDGTQRMGQGAVLYIVSAVARALDHASTRRGADGKSLKIVHHDVTPSNVMVRRDGHVKLVDFGVARSAVMSRLTAGSLRGKLPYLSPEHTRPGYTVDARADLFSLGLCAFEWLSGHRALEVGEPESLEDAYARLPHKLAEFSSRNLVSADTIQLLRDLLQLEATDRCANAGSVADRAESILVALGQGSPARSLAAELADAFAVLEARASSFDQTLAQTLGFVEGIAPSEATGTLSLPGLDAVQIAAASAREEPPSAPQAPKKRGRKRWTTAALVAVALAMATGFWWGATRSPPTQFIQAPSTGSESAPVAAALPVAATWTMADAGSHDAETAQGLPEVATVVAQIPATTATESDNAATDAANPKLKQKKAALKEEEAQATVEFRVSPADAVVAVDGKRQRTLLGDRYVLHLTPGKHVIRATDPDNRDDSTEKAVELTAGERLIIKGGLTVGRENLFNLRPDAGPR